MAAQWLHSLRSFDLRELDLGHPGVWSPKRKNLVALAWLGMILALGYP